MKLKKAGFLSSWLRPEREDAASRSAKKEMRSELLLSRGDADFEGWYREGLLRCAMNDNFTRKQRFYNLVQFFRQVIALEGSVAECGAWRGLSSYLICRCAQSHLPDFSGRDYHVIDSFEGLPEPGPEDRIPGKGSEDIRGKFLGTPEEVSRALERFPKIHYHRGWIPDVFRNLSETVYKFVHVDVDLYRPTRDALNYFVPKLAPKGILVCDDYASPGWPGAKKAVDDFCREKNLSALVLSTGQAVFLGPYASGNLS